MRAYTQGQRFGDYVLEERIAIGGTAEVYLARPTSGVRPAPHLVIKRLLATLLEEPLARTMFADEAAIHQRFVHPNIVTCYGAGAAEGEPYLAMELVQGADLHRVLRLVQARKRPVTAPLATHIAREMLAALAAVHEGCDERGHVIGIVHRDVSPSNIYLSTSGDVKLGDFGIAGSESGGRRNAGGTALRGKFAYLSPEQVASEPVDHRSDLFAVANVLAEMLLGRPLFPGSGQLAVLLAIRDARLDLLDDAGDAIPTPLVTILKRALARSPSARYPDARAFSEALASFSWHDRAAARREVAQLVRWARESSLEMRALGQHPSSPNRPLVTEKPPPTFPDEAQATPIRAVPQRPKPKLRLDPSLLDSLTVREVEPRPSQEDLAVTAPFAPPPSQVRTTDGRLLGPYPYAKLMELITTGRIDADDEIDFMGAGWVPLRDIDELARHVAPRSTTTRQIQGPGAPDWVGAVAERYDPDIGGAIDPGIATALGFVASREGTGVLIATQPGGKRKEIYLKGGRLHHVASSEAAEMIGEYLVGRGLIDRTDLDFALAVLPRFGGHLGEALTGLGLLPAVVVFKAIREQGRDKVLDVFRWSEGDLAFYKGAEPAHVDFPLDLGVGPVVEAGVASMLDDAAATARYRPWIDRRVLANAVAPSLRDAGWSPAALRAFELAHSPITVRALLRAVNAEVESPHQAARIVESLRVVKMIDWTS